MKWLADYQVREVLEERIRVVYDHTAPDGTFNCKIDGIAEAASAILELQSSIQPRHTGWWVMVKQDGEGGWECVGFVNENWDDAELEIWWEELPAFDVIMPIPDPDDERLGEWDGF